MKEGRQAKYAEFGGQAMTLHGHIENGRVIFNEAVDLPNGTEVTVSVLTKGTDSEEDVPTLYEQLKPFIGTIEGLPPDASTNVDHDLYGHPKK